MYTLRMKVDIRLPGKVNSNSVAQGRSTKMISMIMWTRTSRLSIKISLSTLRRSRPKQSSIRDFCVDSVQGYLAYEKQPSRRTLQ